MCHNTDGPVRKEEEEEEERSMEKERERERGHEGGGIRK